MKRLILWASGAHRLIDLPEEFIHSKAGLADDGSQRAWGECARVVRNCGSAPGLRVVPDFMASFSRAVENKAVRAQVFGYLAIA